MSFLNKSSFGSKPSLVKPIAIIIAILLVIGGSYTLLGKKNNSAEANKEQAAEAEVQPSGLDKGSNIDNVGDVEKVIAKWIEANPKAIIASVTNMQKKAMEQQAQDAQKNISGKKDEIFNDPNSASYAPAGFDVTIVEFFDYSCGYCKKAQSSVSELLKQDKKVKIIYKEYPILGQASVDMSQVAVAVNIIDSAGYKKFHDALMKSNAHSKDEAIKIAKSVGINGEKLEKTLKNEQEKIAKILQDNSTLGASIGITGTPGFIIGEELIPGAVDVATLKEKIAAIRSKK
ncbi:MAG: DsbA family protein [Proteobacteria bacterium]|nr:DsbA family protein [Pseudomonadota bacterium]